MEATGGDDVLVACGVKRLKPLGRGVILSPSFAPSARNKGAFFAKNGAHCSRTKLAISPRDADFIFLSAVIFRVTPHWAPVRLCDRSTCPILN